MRLAIRWKLMLGIGVPLLALLGLLLFLDYARLRESAYAETERREAEVAERYAASLDGTLRSLAQGAKTLASVFESNASFSEAEVYDFLARNVQSDGLIFGSALALEPGGWPFRMNEMGPPAPSSIPVAARPARAGFEPRGDLHAPYVFRGARTAGVDGAGAEAWAGLLRLDVAESYDYTDGQWAWYDGPSRSGLARWTEPYFDENAGNAAMVTFSQPFFRDGAFRGVVTVDVDLEGLSRRLRGAAGAEIILLSRRGAVVAGPAMFKPMEENIFEIAKRVGRPELERLGSEMVLFRRRSSDSRNYRGHNQVPGRDAICIERRSHQHGRCRINGKVAELLGGCEALVPDYGQQKPRGEKHDRNLRRGTEHDDERYVRDERLGSGK